MNENLIRVNKNRLTVINIKVINKLIHLFINKLNKYEYIKIKEHIYIYFNIFIYLNV